MFGIPFTMNQTVPYNNKLKRNEKKKKKRWACELVK